jgi:hypothetical protein
MRTAGYTEIKRKQYTKNDRDNEITRKLMGTVFMRITNSVKLSDALQSVVFLTSLCLENEDAMGKGRYSSTVLDLSTRWR